MTAGTSSQAYRGAFASACNAGSSRPPLDGLTCEGQA